MLLGLLARETGSWVAERLAGAVAQLGLPVSSGEKTTFGITAR